jgi:hypothetical protein
MAHAHCYSSPMTTPNPSTDMRAMLHSAGIDVTDEGVQRAKERRREFQENWTPERFAELRRRLNLSEPTA